MVYSSSDPKNGTNYRGCNLSDELNSLDKSLEFFSPPEKNCEKLFSDIKISHLNAEFNDCAISSSKLPGQIQYLGSNFSGLGCQGPFQITGDSYDTFSKSPNIFTRSFKSKSLDNPEIADSTKRLIHHVTLPEHKLSRSDSGKDKKGLHKMPLNLSKSHYKNDNIILPPILQLDKSTTNKSTKGQLITKSERQVQLKATKDNDFPIVQSKSSIPLKGRDSTDKLSAIDSSSKAKPLNKAEALKKYKTRMENQFHKVDQIKNIMNSKDQANLNKNVVKYMEKAETSIQIPATVETELCRGNKTKKYGSDKTNNEIIKPIGMNLDSKYVKHKEPKHLDTKHTVKKIAQESTKDPKFCSFSSPRRNTDSVKQVMPKCIYSSKFPKCEDGFGKFVKNTTMCRLPPKPPVEEMKDCKILQKNKNCKWAKKNENNHVWE